MEKSDRKSIASNIPGLSGYWEEQVGMFEFAAGPGNLA